MSRLSRSLALVVVPALSALACASGGNTSGTSGNSGGASSSSSSASATTSSSGTGGATSSSSSTSSGSGGGAGGATSSSSSSSSGAGGGMPCHWQLANPCGAGMFCNADGCGDGTCQPVGASEDPTRAPICGCDGVTYWNTSVATKHGMPKQAGGECSPAKTCGGFGNLQCPAGASCDYKQASKAGCGGADLSGACWVVPAVCMQMVGIGPQTRACGAAVCTDECDLIKQQKLWYPDNTCPQ